MNRKPLSINYITNFLKVRYNIKKNININNTNLHMYSNTAFAVCHFITHYNCRNAKLNKLLLAHLFIYIKQNYGRIMYKFIKKEIYIMYKI